MDLIFFTRAEEEPLRQSYDRKMVYIVKNGYLYHRRFSTGRVQEDIPGTGPPEPGRPGPVARTGPGIRKESRSRSRPPGPKTKNSS